MPVIKLLRLHTATAQMQLCMVVFCTFLVLLSLIALSWRKYGSIIMRAQNDPNWKVRDILTPNSSPTMKASKKVQ